MGAGLRVLTSARKEGPGSRSQVHWRGTRTGLAIGSTSLLPIRNPSRQFLLRRARVEITHQVLQLVAPWICFKRGAGT